MDDPQSVTSSTPNAQPVPDSGPPQPDAGTKPLIYEETPVINPVPAPVTDNPPVISSPTPQAPPAESQATPQPHVQEIPKKRPNVLVRILGNTIVFVLLFFLGIWLSMYIRPLLQGSVALPTVPSTANPTGEEQIAVPEEETIVDPLSEWKSYQVISGATKQPIEGVMFRLPPDVLTPICDGAACASQGTYLSGGTRFTVAARGVGQVLPNPRGAVLVDTSGRAFTSEDTIVAGFPASEFTGSFNGTTGSGYAFSEMRGVMVYVSDVLTIEFNYFIPTGIDTDYEADSASFRQIIASLTTTSGPPTPTVVPGIPTPLVPTSTVSATPTL